MLSMGRRRIEPELLDHAEPEEARKNKWSNAEDGKENEALIGK